MTRVSIWYNGPQSKKKKKGLRLDAEVAVHTCHLSLLSTKRALVNLHTPTLLEKRME